MCYVGMCVAMQHVGGVQEWLGMGERLVQRLVCGGFGSGEVWV